MRSDDEDRRHAAGLTDSKLADIDEFCKLTDTAMRSVLVQGAASPRWSDLVETLDDWCLTMGHGSRPLNEIFSSAWQDPGNGDAVRGKMSVDLGARYWVPLLGLFHGDRVHEALQLVACDFSFIKGLFVLTFRKELDAQDSLSHTHGARHRSMATRLLRIRFNPANAAFQASAASRHHGGPPEHPEPLRR